MVSNVFAPRSSTFKYFLMTPVPGPSGIVNESHSGPSSPNMSSTPLMTSNNGNSDRHNPDLDTPQVRLDYHNSDDYN